MNSTTSVRPSSSSALHFPLMTPRKERPDTHPYAIQTSSTAILSRSTSTSAHPSVGPHHYIPMSPSSSSPNESPTKLNRSNKHRYSRSLTSDLPPPLPLPPNQSSPIRRSHRIESLPSSAGSPQVSLFLPEDPESWTPNQLSMYLATTLRAGDASLPVPVAKDIANFVSERRITGKTFLRFSQEDLLHFGLNQLCRSTILSSSRELRRTKGIGYTGPSGAKEDSGNTSSSSNDHRYSRGRTRHTSITNHRGKVQNLVDRLENSSPASSGLGASDESDDAEFFANKTLTSDELLSSNHSHTPSKSNRTLPQRGSVNDLFDPTPTVHSDPTVAVNEGDSTVRPAAKRKAFAKAPRMLPYPPMQAPVITPAHTGTNFPLPLSPELTGNNYIQGTDYEMGFRPRVYSPHSQVFVVRHNPASPSNSLHVNEKSNKRPLPFPPLAGETHLHHPKPQRLVGNIDNPSTEDDTLDGASNPANPSRDEDTITIDIKPANEIIVDEEPTVGELMASEDKHKPISGAEAWELELGETVKRVGSEHREFIRGEFVGEIVRKSGRPSIAFLSGREVEDSSRCDSVANVFDQPERRPESATETTELQLKLEALEENLRLREQHLSEKIQAISERELAVSEREQAIAAREQLVQCRELDFRQKEETISLQWSSKEKEIQANSQAAEHRQKVLEVEHEKLMGQKLEITMRDEKVTKTEAELRIWETRIKAQEDELNQRIGVNDASALAASEFEPTWPTPVNILRKCWQILGVDLPPPASNTVITTSTPRETSTQKIRRDILFGPSDSGGYLVLMSIGVCVVALKVLDRFRRR